MFTSIRIVANVENQGSRGGVAFQRVPDLADVRVYGVRDDGTWEEITCVEEITWTVKADAEPAKATLKFAAVSVDVVGEIEEGGTSTPEGQHLG